MPEPARLAEKVDVTGIVVTDLDDPILGRSVVLVDARGQRHDAVTNEVGAFAFGEVTAPYDLAVASASSSAMTVYLGLRRSDPYVELLEREGPTPAPESQRVRVGVRIPACGAGSDWVTVVTTSASGAGTATTPCLEGERLVTLEVEHAWRALSVMPTELIDAHVLVGDHARSSFAHARVDGIVAAPGETVDVGPIDPVAVPMTDPITIGARDGVGELVDWRWTTSVLVDFSGDPMRIAAGVLLAAVPVASTTMRLPLIPGVTIQANVSASHPRGGDQGGFQRSTEGWSGVRALSPDPIVLDVGPGPEIVRPIVGGHLSQRGLGFEWSAVQARADRAGHEAKSPSLSTLTVADTARGGLRFRVLTVGQKLTLGRLSMLGIPKLELGDHELGLSTSPDANVDDAVSPEAAVRRRHLDRTRAGAATYLRVPFQVTN